MPLYGGQVLSGFRKVDGDYAGVLIDKLGVEFEFTAVIQAVPACQSCAALSAGSPGCVNRQSGSACSL